MNIHKPGQRCPRRTKYVEVVQGADAAAVGHGIINFVYF